MSMDVVKNNQLVSDLPLSVSGQREVSATKDAVGKGGSVDTPSIQQNKVAETEAGKIQRDDQADRLQQSVNRLNQQLKSNELKFEVVRELGIAVVKVIDTADGKVIRQIPSEEAVKRLEDIQKYLEQSVYQQDTAQLKDSLTGLIFNQTL